MLMFPIKEYENTVYENASRHIVLIIMNTILMIVAGIILFKGYYPVTSICIMLITLFNLISSIRLYSFDNRKLKDFTDCKIELGENGIMCSQTNNEDSFEECRINFNDVEKVVEGVSKGSCGFYIYVSEKNESVILTNNVYTDRKVFYINGHGYDPIKFRKLYLDFVSRLNSKTAIVGTRHQKSWFDKTETQEIISQLLPFVILIIIFFLHLMLSF